VSRADGKSAALDFREVAPRAAKAQMFLDKQGEPTKDSLIGARAAGIAGSVAGFGYAHERWASQPWRKLLEPAVALARDGHELDALHAEEMANAAKQMLALGFESSAAVYLSSDGAPLPTGARFSQPELAETLSVIAEQGPSAFYKGPLAKRIVKGVRALGGIWSERDLADYKPIERAPLEVEYRGHRVLTMPPPSAGGIVLAQLLHASEILQLARKPYRGAEAMHLYLEAARRAYADRNYLVADPEFVRVPTETLSSREYVARRIADIDPKRATSYEQVRPGDPSTGKKESTETTHYSVLDAQGNAVSVTYTLNASFGARVVVPGTGILLNDEMDDFAVKPGAVNLFGLKQGANNAIAPGKRMLSSMTPTIVLEGTRVRAVLGSPGGPTITTTVAQILMALLDHGVPLHQAVRAPRVHHQWLPDQVSIEADVEPTLAEGLRALGHVIAERPAGSIGHANCVERDPSTGLYVAVADVTRRGGSALAH
jgi:gamma-glutamyltranspeptidase/glutathione hydrolase